LQENACHAELERYLFKAKEILSQNRDFLHAVANSLLERGVLLHSDMRRIRESVTIIPAVIG
jgi:ATP-dependent Zn protease